MRSPDTRPHKVAAVSRSCQEKSISSGCWSFEGRPQVRLFAKSSWMDFRRPYVRQVLVLGNSMGEGRAPVGTRSNSEI